MNETLEKLIEKYNAKTISLVVLEKEIKDNIKDEGFFQSSVDRQPFLDSLSLEQAMIELAKKTITQDELTRIVAKAPDSSAYFLADQKNPYADGNEDSRCGFTWNHIFTTQGQFFQNVAKRIGLKTIQTIHKGMIKHYDQNIFVYDDPRLITLDIFAKSYIMENFQKDDNYKTVFMCQLVDIVLGLCKEDVYYRARMFAMMRKFVMHFPKAFELSAMEKLNIETWH